MNRVTVPWSLGNGWRLLKSGYGTVLKMVILPYLALFAPLVIVGIIILIIGELAGLPITEDSADLSTGMLVVSIVIGFIINYIVAVLTQLMTIGILFSLYDWIKNKNKKPKFSQAFQAFTRSIFGRVIPYVLLSTLFITIIETLINVLSSVTEGSENIALSFLTFFLSLIGRLFILQLQIVLYGAYFLIKSDSNKKSKSKGGYLSGAWNKLAGNKWRAFGGLILINAIVVVFMLLFNAFFELIYLHSSLPVRKIVIPINFVLIFLLLLAFILLLIPWFTSAVASFYSKAIPAKNNRDKNTDRLSF